MRPAASKQNQAALSAHHLETLAFARHVHYGKQERTDKKKSFPYRTIAGYLHFSV